MFLRRCPRSSALGRVSQNAKLLRLTAPPRTLAHAGPRFPANWGDLVWSDTRRWRALATAPRNCCVDVRWLCHRIHRPREHLSRSGRDEGAVRLVANGKGPSPRGVLRRVPAVHFHGRSACRPLRRQARAGYSVVAWSIFTLLTPLAATLSLAVLVSTRIVVGAGEAGMFPAGLRTPRTFDSPRQKVPAPRLA